MNTRGLLLLAGTAGFALALSSAPAMPSGSLTFPIVGPTNVLWDLTTITNLEHIRVHITQTNRSSGTVEGPHLDFADPFTQDGRGRLHGLGTNNVVLISGDGLSTNNFPARTTTSGSVTSLKGVANASFRAAITAKTFLEGAERSVSASATYTFKLNAPLNQLTGHKSFYASATGKGSISSSGPLGPEAFPSELGDGSWTLRLDFAVPVLNRLSGNATATLRTGQVYPFTFTGSYATLTGISHLSLKGIANALGSSLQLTLDSGNNITRMLGTISGQTINFGPGLISTQPLVQFQYGTYSAVAATGLATITVSRYGDPSGSNCVNYATSDGTALAGTDYLAAQGTLCFAPGDQSESFTVPLLENPAADASTMLNLALSAPSAGCVLGPQQHAVLVISNEVLLQFSTNTFLANITDSQSFITVTRMGRLGETVAVDYTTANDPNSPTAAQDGTDYQGVSGTLTFGPQVTIATFSVPLLISGLINDHADTIDLLLSNPGTNAVLGTPISAVLSIQRPPPVLSVTPTSVGLCPPCSLSNSVTVANAGAPGSVLAYQVSIADTNQSQFVTINDVVSSVGVSGILFDGQSDTIEFKMAPTFPMIGSNLTLTASFTANGGSPLQLSVPVYVQNCLTNLLGTWQGSWGDTNGTSCGFVFMPASGSGTWQLQLQQVDVPNQLLYGVLNVGGNEYYCCNTNLCTCASPSGNDYPLSIASPQSSAPFGLDSAGNVSLGLWQLYPVQNVELGEFSFTFDVLNGLTSGRTTLEHFEPCITFSTIGFQTGSRIGP